MIKRIIPWNKGLTMETDPRIKSHKVSEDVKKKLAKSKMGKKNPFYGKKHSSEALAKIIKAHKGKKESEITKFKIGLGNLGNKRPDIKEYMGGEKHWNWKGGIKPLNKKIRSSLEYKLWRKSVFERDNYQCVWGGKEHGNKLNADHIKSFSQYPELRFAIDNGRTLCVECHRKTDTWGTHLSK